MIALVAVVFVGAKFHDYIPTVSTAIVGVEVLLPGVIADVVQVIIHMLTKSQVLAEFDLFSVHLQVLQE